ncbi:hypothetical protein AAF712_013308 [Marasmius tenuissimus]|uniref:Uncharacterized protein n=1 Tax=Marasmius tenuissimus TaxID=585030 RepID=A0ABR2ZEZ6_9AGAR
MSSTVDANVSDFQHGTDDANGRMKQLELALKERDARLQQQAIDMQERDRVLLQRSAAEQDLRDELATVKQWAVSLKLEGDRYKDRLRQAEEKVQGIEEAVSQERRLTRPLIETAAATIEIETVLKGIERMEAFCNQLLPHVRCICGKTFRDPYT